MLDMLRLTWRIGANLCVFGVLFAATADVCCRSYFPRAPHDPPPDRAKDAKIDALSAELAATSGELERERGKNHELRLTLDDLRRSAILFPRRPETPAGDLIPATSVPTQP